MPQIEVKSAENIIPENSIAASLLDRIYKALSWIIERKVFVPFRQGYASFFGTNVPKIQTNKANATPEIKTMRPTNILDPVLLATLNTIKVYNKYLDTKSIIAFSNSCKEAKGMTVDAIKESRKRDLLIVVLESKLKSTADIAKVWPELLIESYANINGAKDATGKEVHESPLKVAISAWDIPMLRKLKEVLQPSVEQDMKLSFNLGVEVQRQFKKIFPKGVAFKEKAQEARAEEFKTVIIKEIFDTLVAATDEQVRYELTNPKQIVLDSPLNIILNNFRAKFIDTSKEDQVFNAFYLLKTFEFYESNLWGDFNDINRRNLFWEQVIRYMCDVAPPCWKRKFYESLYTTVSGLPLPTFGGEAAMWRGARRGIKEYCERKQKSLELLFPEVVAPDPNPAVHQSNKTNICLMM